jgi:hypothetical protein
MRGTDIGSRPVGGHTRWRRYQAGSPTREMPAALHARNAGRPYLGAPTGHAVQT